LPPTNLLGAWLTVWLLKLSSVPSPGYAATKAHRANRLVFPARAEVSAHFAPHYCRWFADDSLFVSALAVCGWRYGCFCTHGHRYRAGLSPCALPVMVYA